MTEERMKFYIEKWFDSGFTLKDLMKIILEVTKSHHYIDH